MNTTYTYEDILAMFADTDKRMKETDRRMKETDRRMKETETYIKEIGKQIGGLSNKFGKFTEDIFMDSLQKLMKEKFYVQEFIANSFKRIYSIGEIEIDAMGVVNGDINSVYIAEIKSKFDNEAIEQLEKNISKINTFYPELKDKKKIGLIVLPNIEDEVKFKIMKAGFIPVSLKDDLAIIKSPEDFAPKEF
ncbi:MAG: DUF3782 domain-containing protein [Candidatus Kapaibacteriota bacterium]|jgi:hypothetical protein